MGDPTTEQPKGEQPKGEKPTTEQPTTPGPQTTGGDKPTTFETPSEGAKEKKKPSAPAPQGPKPSGPAPKENEDKTSYADKWMKSFESMHKEISKAYGELFDAIGDKAAKAFKESGPGKKIMAALDEFKSELDGLKKRVGDSVGGAVGKVTQPIGDLADKAANKLADGIAAAIGKATSAMKPKEKSEEPEKGKDEGQEKDASAEKGDGLVEKVKAALQAVKDFVTSPSLKMGTGGNTKKPESEMIEMHDMSSQVGKPKTESPQPGQENVHDNEETTTLGKK